MPTLADVLEARCRIEATRTLVEAAGAAPLAARMGLCEQLLGKRVALVANGANASREHLLDVLAG